MTLQTLAVLTLGALLGARLAAATVVLYLAEGLAGLPVFAGAVAGRPISSGRPAAIWSASSSRRRWSGDWPSAAGRAAGRSRWRR